MSSAAGAGADGRVRVARAAVVITALTAVARVGGLIRQIVFTRTIGAGPITDAYLAAFTLVTVPASVLQRAVPVTLLPRFASERRAAGEREAWRLASAYLVAAAAALAVVAVVLVVAADPFARLLLGREGVSPSLTADLSRIMAPALALQALSFAIGALLQAHDRFAATAFGGLLLNIGTIAGTVLLYGPIGVRGVAVGTTFGALAAILIQVPGLRAIAPPGGFAWRRAGVGAMMLTALPVVLNSVQHNINAITDVFFSTTQRGGLTALRNAGLVVGMPQTLFAPTAYDGRRRTSATGLMSWPTSTPCLNACLT